MNGRPTAEPLSRADSAWLRMDERNNHFVVTSLLILEKPIDLAHLRATLAARMDAQPRLRQRVLPPLLPLQPHRWEDDPEFDLDAHLHRIGLPGDQGEKELAEYIGDLAGRPLDGARALWELHLVERYQGGSALVSRIHHALGDGAALVEALLQLTDIKVHGTWLPALAPKRKHDEHALTQALKTAAHLAVHPRETVTDGIRLAGTIARLTLNDPDPPSPLRGTLGLRKKVAWSRAYPLADLKAVAKKARCTLNDVLTSAVAGGLGEHLGWTPPNGAVHAMVPVNVRDPSRAVRPGNEFSLVMAELPIGVRHPWERVMRTKLEMDRIKASFEPLAGWVLIVGMGLSPLPVERAVGEFYARKSSLVLTNVPGPEQRLYMAGSPIKAMAFWEPESSGLGIGVSIFSYAGEVRLAMITDAGIVEEPKRVVEGIERALDALLGDGAKPVAQAATAAAAG